MAAMPSTGDLGVDQVERIFLSALQQLTFNSKPIINALTMQAGHNRGVGASGVVRALERHLEACGPALKLPGMYLMDSIVKNIGEPYITLFARNLPKTFSSVFAVVDPKTQFQLKRLSGTWTQSFSPNVLTIIRKNVERAEQAQAAAAAAAQQQMRMTPQAIPPVYQPQYPMQVYQQQQQPPFLPHTQTDPTVGSYNVITQPHHQPQPYMHAIPQQQPYGQVYMQPQYPPQMLMRPQGTGMIDPSPPYGAMQHPPVPLQQPLVQGQQPLPVGTHPPAADLSSMLAAVQATIQNSDPVRTQEDVGGNSEGAREPGNDPSSLNFDPAYMRERHEDVLNALYWDLPVQSKVSGRRFKSEDGLQKHMDSIFAERRRKIGGVLQSRCWWPTSSDWLEGKVGVPTVEGAAGFFNEGTKGSEKNTAEGNRGAEKAAAKGVPSLPVDESQPSCALSGEKFEVFWNEEEEEWRYKDCVRLADGRLVLASLAAGPASPPRPLASSGQQHQDGMNISGTSDAPSTVADIADIAEATKADDAIDLGKLEDGASLPAATEDVNEPSAKRART